MVIVALLAASVGPGDAAEVKILLPLKRTAYQTNERIELSVLRTDKAALAVGQLVLNLQGEDGSKLRFGFTVKKVEADKAEARAVEHFFLNGWLLRPGKYLVEVTCDGASARQQVEVYSHVRRSNFRLINWGRANNKAVQLTQGEENLGYNLFYGGYGKDTDGDLIRAGVDFMSCCTMGGGHQMDLRMECDWSDPLVIRGGTRRVARRAFQDRSRPNVPGVHFYDEPGLTWWKDPATGKDTPQGIPAQVRSFEAAFSEPPPDYRKLDPKNPEHVRRWAHWARWKLGFMDAAWQDAQFGVTAVRADYISATQSQYGWSAFTDGYYFSVVRSLPVISGHGGYHDFGPGYFNPSYFLEMARAHDLARPNWYLPCWYGNTTSDEFRLEQYLSFQTGIQGMMSPPDLEPGDPSKSKAAAGIVQSNKLMGRLGTIFTTMPPTRPPVAMLYSLSQEIHDQTLDREVSYAHSTPHGKNLPFTYLAGRLIQQPFMPVLDEDVLDGTLAAHHKAVILTTIDYLDPDVIDGLEDFARRGGLVLMTGDSKVHVKGAVNLGVTPQLPDAPKVEALIKAKNYQEAGKLTTLRHHLAGCRKLAEALRQRLEKAGIRPVLVTDMTGITATRQAAGDVEYLFAVNASHDQAGNPQLGLKAVEATIGFEDDARPIYDAVHGGLVTGLVQKARESLVAKPFLFGPGQMMVFARTARPIGAVNVGTPVLHRDFTQGANPIHLDISAVVMDNQSGLLSGSIPLHIQVTDALGELRYDMHRATEQGTLRLRLPLGLNDPPGKWIVKVTELLNNSHSTASVDFPAVAACNVAAGAVRRAVFLADDRANIFRFFRTHRRVTIVKGAGDYEAASERLAHIVKPWNVACTAVNAADVKGPCSLSAEEATTWAGLEPGRAQAGDKNNPAIVGFAVQGPVILLGTPEDNPLIKSLLDWKFLPYVPTKGEFPGPGRGMVAWQREGIGVLQESITLIAHDRQGMAEAVGTMFEMAAGIDPLTPWVLARDSAITPATKGRVVTGATVAWSVVLPDEIVGLKTRGDKVAVLTKAGVVSDLDGAGKASVRAVLEGPAYQKLSQELTATSDATALAHAQKRAEPGRVVKLVATQQDLTAVAYWGGRVEVFRKDGTLRLAWSGPQDITAIAWSAGRAIVGDADGRVTALVVK
jgi:hypothetical protein